MGIVKDVKASTAQKDAVRARDEGRTVFLYKYAAGPTTTNWSGPIAGAAETIEAIESTGWQLYQMAYSDSGKHGAVVLMFRPRRP
jgi:hypothetical protein